MDRDRVRPRACMHRHKLNEKRPGVGATGPNEVLDLLAVLRPMVQGEEAVEGVRQIFSTCPATTWDNFFSGDDLMDHPDVGDKWPIMGTVRRDRLPKGVPGKYMHKKKTSQVASARKLPETLPPSCSPKATAPTSRSSPRPAATSAG